MRIQSRNGYNDGLDDLDPYFTCPEAIGSLLTLEGDRLPRRLWEPAAGNGAIVHPLRATGRSVIASDIHDYGLEGCALRDYLTTDPPPGIKGIVTNPPYRQALQFAEKALSEVPYVAFLVRSNFDVEGVKRMAFRACYPPNPDMAIGETPSNDAPVWLERTTGTEQHTALLAGLGSWRAAPVPA